MLPASATFIPFGYVSHHPKFVSYVAIQAIYDIYGYTMLYIDINPNDDPLIC